MQYHFITTTQGNSILGCSSNGAMAYALVGSDAVATIDDINATPEEYGSLLRQVATHDFKFDPTTRRVTAHLRQSKKATS